MTSKHFPPDVVWLSVSEGVDLCNYEGYTEPGFYFWDETQAYCHGPYEYEEAIKLYKVYYSHPDRLKYYL